MKKFNRVISVTVSVDDIAQKLCKAMSQEFEHGEMVAETIIGSLVNSNGRGLSMLFNSLNGYKTDVDFRIGQEVECEETVHSYAYNNTKEEWVTGWNRLGHAKIIDIDVYSDTKLHIEYTYYNKNKEAVKDTRWVTHTSCSGIVLKDVEGVEMA